MATSIIPQLQTNRLIAQTLYLGSGSSIYISPSQDRQSFLIFSDWNGHPVCGTCGARQSYNRATWAGAGGFTASFADGVITLTNADGAAYAPVTVISEDSFTFTV